MFTYSREKAHLSKSALFQCVAAGALLLLSMLIYIYPSIQATNLMYEYSYSLERLAELKELNKKLKLEVSTLRSYDFIENEAFEKLGYVAPAPGQVVIIAKK